MTEPYRCRLDDDRLYALKGRGALPRGLIAEAVCARLGSYLDLPIPECAIAHVGEDLVGANCDLNFTTAIGAGYAFASLWQEPAITVNRSWLERLDRRMLARVYVFDHWIKNGDRSLTELGGNPNLLVALRTGTLRVIDHNLAFSPSYDASELQLHACREAWLDENENLVFKQECEHAMSAAIQSLPTIMGELPEDWLDCVPGIEAEMRTVLERIKFDEFWSELT